MDSFPSPSPPTALEQCVALAAFSITLHGSSVCVNEDRLPGADRPLPDRWPLDLPLAAGFFLWSVGDGTTHSSTRLYRS